MLNAVRRKVTYANVMATIAVFGVLAGGGAYAASKIGPNEIAKNAVRSKHIKNKQVRAGDLSAEAKAYWVRVNGDNGNVYASSPGVTVQRPAEGVYYVRFPKSIRKRALLANLGSEGLGALGAEHVRTTRCGSGPGEGTICGTAQDNSRTVFVETDTNGGGATEDLDFEVVALP